MIKELFTRFNKLAPKSTVDYCIPIEWLPDDYSGITCTKEGRTYVNPYEFGLAVLRKLTNVMSCNENALGSPDSARLSKDGSWISNSRIYCAFVRSTTSFLHEPHKVPEQGSENKYTRSGTFLKMIFLLPHILEMGFDCIYLLPITVSSNRYKKGELGSPYAVKDFFRPDPFYHDTLANGFSVEEQFKAFVEVCHMVDISVLLDFMPRTASRDSELIVDHPEWFYWIDASAEEVYCQPRIPSLDFRVPTVNDLESLYGSEDVQRHLRLFREAPSVSAPDRWKNFVEANRGIPGFFEELVRTFGVVTAPAFSDWINDNQPVWDDITLLRLYLDNPRDSKPFLRDQNQPPYILHDIIKASNFPGESPNHELWNLLGDIMPHYIREYGIDGARLDMGHALPDDLERMIIDEAKAESLSFSIIAEELQMDKDEESLTAGYDCMLGNTWWMEPRLKAGTFKKLIVEVLPNLVLPVLACCETPDTPRAVTRPHGKAFSRMMTALNFFLPNSIPFVNSGQEIFEPQPMNLGLDNTSQGRFVLPPDDPFYGKLAFFDHYTLHWNSPDNLCSLISTAADLSKESGKLISADNMRILWKHDPHITGLLYWVFPKGLLALLNTCLETSVRRKVDLGYHTWKERHGIIWYIKKSQPVAEELIYVDSQLEVSLEPGEIAVAIIE